MTHYQTKDGIFLIYLVDKQPVKPLSYRLITIHRSEEKLQRAQRHHTTAKRLDSRTCKKVQEGSQHRREQSGVDIDNITGTKCDKGSSEFCCRRRIIRLLLQNLKLTEKRFKISGRLMLKTCLGSWISSVVGIQKGSGLLRTAARIKWGVQGGQVYLHPLPTFFLSVVDLLP